MSQVLIDEKKEEKSNQLLYNDYTNAESDDFLSPNILLNTASACRTSYDHMNSEKHDTLEKEKSSKESPKTQTKEIETNDSEDDFSLQDIDVLYEDSTELADLKREFLFSEFVESYINELTLHEQARLEAFHEQLFQFMPASLHGQSISDILDTNKPKQTSSVDMMEYSRLFDFFLMCSSTLPCKNGSQTLEDPQNEKASLSSLNAFNSLKIIESHNDTCGLDDSCNVKKLRRLSDSDFLDNQTPKGNTVPDPVYDQLKINANGDNKTSQEFSFITSDKGSDHQIFKLELESSTPSPPVFSARESILDTVSRLTGHSLKAALKENS